MVRVALAITYHDPHGHMHDQIARVLPQLAGLFGGIAVSASPAAPQASLDCFAGVGALVERQAQTAPRPKIGLARRNAVRLALEFDCPFVMYCDGDTSLHWAERYPQELAHVVARIHECDFTLLGRTQRAFETLPRCQHDTEVMVNQVFQRVSGHAWHITSAARGLSRRAAQAILEGCPDESFSTDASWPLFILQRRDFSMGYIEVEGQEFETADRHQAEVARAGGLDLWRAQLDADPRQWAHRLDMARIEIEAMIPFTSASPRG